MKLKTVLLLDSYCFGPNFKLKQSLWKKQSTLGLLIHTEYVLQDHSHLNSRCVGKQEIERENPIDMYTKAHFAVLQLQMQFSHTV